MLSLEMRLNQTPLKRRKYMKTNMMLVTALGLVTTTLATLSGADK